MPCVAHLMLVMLRHTPFVAHFMLVMVLNLPEQCSFQDLLFHMLFMPKSAEKSASRMDISLVICPIPMVSDAACEAASKNPCTAGTRGGRHRGRRYCMEDAKTVPPRRGGGDEGTVRDVSRLQP